LSEEEAQEIIRRKESEHQMQHLITGGSDTVH